MSIDKSEERTKALAESSSSEIEWLLIPGWQITFQGHATMSRGMKAGMIGIVFIVLPQPR
jgi:hypothetical protein